MLADWQKTIASAAVEQIASYFRNKNSRTTREKNTNFDGNHHLGWKIRFVVELSDFGAHLNLLQQMFACREHIVDVYWVYQREEKNKCNEKMYSVVSPIRLDD